MAGTRAEKALILLRLSGCSLAQRLSGDITQQNVKLSKGHSGRDGTAGMLVPDCMGP